MRENWIHSYGIISTSIQLLCVSYLSIKCPHIRTQWQGEHVSNICFTMVKGLMSKVNILWWRGYVRVCWIWKVLNQQYWYKLLMVLNSILPVFRVPNILWNKSYLRMLRKLLWRNNLSYSFWGPNFNMHKKNLQLAMTEDTGKVDSFMKFA